MNVVDWVKMHAWATFELHPDRLSSHVELRADYFAPHGWVPTNGGARRSTDSECNLWRFHGRERIIQRVDARVEGCAEEDRGILSRIVVGLTQGSIPLMRCPLLDLLEPESGDLAERVAYLERVVQGLLLKTQDESGLEATRRLGVSTFDHDPRALSPTIRVGAGEWFYPSITCDGALNTKSPIVIRITLRGTVATPVH